MPAPKGNVNAMRHGLRCASLPPGCKYIEDSANRIRRELEAAVAERHGEIDIYHGALIQSVVRHETRAMLLYRWLRQTEPKQTSTASMSERNGNKTTSGSKSTTSGLSIMERASLMKDISTATDSRDKCIERLGLSRPIESDAWRVLDVPADAQPHAGERDAEHTERNETPQERSS